ncbi:response regulator [Xanthovirga aplysinae]|uniref:response regulator n=1 Tax=Xanthovirga aplysinae TaxID=2529853 RepID=UPI0012BC78D4|nr:response regulator transcription factor [Xanthovirga aplysinae]MTI31760.1 response regulator transcription factor [Xanthovirga aplysinae]
MSYFKTRIVIIEDDELLKEGYKLVLDSVKNYYVVNAYSHCEEALENLTKDRPDVILMDLDLPGMNGAEGTFEIKKILPQTEVIINTVFENSEQVFKALCSGASGYISKGASYTELLKAFEQVLEGGAPMSNQIARLVVKSFQKNPHSPLTRRETEVLELLAKGKSYSIIADELFVTKETAKSHIKNIYSKLHVKSKSAAIAKAREEKLI